MSDPMILMSAPNGARRMKTDHPLIPLTPQELADTAEILLEHGVSIVHTHVRDAKGGHSLDIDIYSEAINTIKSRVGDSLIIQVTSEAVGVYSPEQQEDMVRSLKPEAVSLALRELCPDQSHEQRFAKLVSWCADERVFPQYILYDVADLQRFEDMQRRGIIQDNPFVLLVLGQYAAGDTNEALGEKQALMEAGQQLESPFAVCGFGVDEIKAVEYAALNNGHARVGFENNIIQNEQTLLSGHDVMLRAASDIAKQNGRHIATTDSVRERFAQQLP